MKTLKLTELENELVNRHFKVANGNCGANTIEELLQDNHSCATVEDLQGVTLTKKQVAGLIGSLSNKGVISIEERENDTDLYWLNDKYLETLPRDLKLTKENEISLEKPSHPYNKDLVFTEEEISKIDTLVKLRKELTTEFKENSEDLLYNNTNMSIVKITYLKGSTIPYSVVVEDTDEKEYIEKLCDWIDLHYIGEEKFRAKKGETDIALICNGMFINTYIEEGEDTEYYTSPVANTRRQKYIDYNLSQDIQLQSDIDNKRQELQRLIKNRLEYNTLLAKKLVEVQEQIELEGLDLEIQTILDEDYFEVSVMYPNRGDRQVELEINTNGKLFNKYFEGNKMVPALAVKVGTSGYSRNVEEAKQLLKETQTALRVIEIMEQKGIKIGG